MFQVNHLSQFLLLRLLENRLADNARVAFVSSLGYFMDSVMNRSVYGQKPGGRKGKDEAQSQWITYADTKLMQILSANTFARLYAPKNILVNSLCPGLVESGFQDRMPSTLMTRIIKVIISKFGRSPREGALRGVQILTDPKLNKTGVFYDSYVKLPLSGQVSRSNEDWLFEKSNELVGF